MIFLNKHKACVVFLSWNIFHAIYFHVGLVWSDVLVYPRFFRFYATLQVIAVPSFTGLSHKNPATRKMIVSRGQWIVWRNTAMGRARAEQGHSKGTVRASKRRGVGQIGSMGTTGYKLRSSQWARGLQAANETRRWIC